MGFRTPLKIEQERVGGDSSTQIAFTTPQTRKDQYGMVFCVKFLNDTENALESKSASTAAGGVSTMESIKTLGLIKGVYHYFLVKVAPDTQSRTETTVQFNFTSSSLKNGKMVMDFLKDTRLINSRTAILPRQMSRHTCLTRIYKTLTKINLKTSWLGMSFLPEDNNGMEQSPQTSR